MLQLFTPKHRLQPHRSQDWCLLVCVHPSCFYGGSSFSFLVSLGFLLISMGDSTKPAVWTTMAKWTHLTWSLLLQPSQWLLQRPTVRDSVKNEGLIAHWPVLHVFDTLIFLLPLVKHFSEASQLRTGGQWDHSWTQGTFSQECVCLYISVCTNTLKTRWKLCF